MKKFIPVIILAVCGLSLLAYHFLKVNEDSSSTKESSETLESTLDTQITQQSTIFNDSSTEESQTKESSQEIDELDVEILIEKFSNKWLNFDDVYERNQAIKPFVTEEYAKENTLDVDPHAQYESKGEIESISRNITKNNSYVVLGKEKSKDYVNDFVLVLELNDEQTKISFAEMSYVKKGY